MFHIVLFEGDRTQSYIMPPSSKRAWAGKHIIACNICAGKNATKAYYKNQCTNPLADTVFELPDSVSSRKKPLNKD